MRSKHKKVIAGGIIDPALPLIWDSKIGNLGRVASMRPPELMVWVFC